MLTVNFISETGHPKRPKAPCHGAFAGGGDLPIKRFDPMLDEEALLRRQQRGGGSDQRTQRGAHLQGDEHEDDEPHLQVPEIGRGGAGRAGGEALDEADAEPEAGHPEEQVEQPHHDEAVGGLGKDPRDRGEADEQEREERDHAEERPGRLRGPDIGAVEAQENV